MGVSGRSGEGCGDRNVIVRERGGGTKGKAGSWAGKTGAAGRNVPGDPACFGGYLYFSTCGRGRLTGPPDSVAPVRQRNHGRRGRPSPLLDQLVTVRQR